jgi:iron complex transport system permease protein
VRQPVVVSLILLAACAVTVIISIGLGGMNIPPLEVIRSLIGIGGEDQTLVIMKLRLPRIVLSLLVGASLSAAGAILQSVIRNPLASPDMIGITGGASVAAVAFITYTAGAVSIHWLPLSAMTGAVIVSGLLYWFAWKKGVTPIRLVLVGVGMSSLMSAMTTMMIVFSPKNDPGQAFLWLIGSVYGANWMNVVTLLPWTAIFIPLAFLMTRHVNIGQLGDEMAISAGSSVQRTRLGLILISVALAGSAVSIAGGVAFVGLLAPHMARKLVGTSFGNLLPVSVIIGSIIVTLADLAGRTLFMPLDIPLGVFVSAVGAPFFLYLLYARRNFG